jgi:hypothetical protein
MQRITPIPVINPTDDSPIPAPKLSFNVQASNPAFPTGGLFSSGNLRFNLNSVIMVELAKQAFLNNSSFSGSADALNTFLLCLSSTSTFEGGFDAVNTYDRAGISIGFLQFARPEGGAGRLLEMAGREDLANEIRNQFGISDPHNSPAAVQARSNRDLLSQIVTAISGPDGIRSQLAMAINKNVAGQFYFEKAYGRFLDLQLKDPLCCALLFDAAVNMGAGSMSSFSTFNQTDDGSWIKAAINVLSRPERRTGWTKLLSQNFA